jgi:hypothetical protein
MTFRVERGEGIWKVLGKGVRIEVRDLEWAVFDAITLAEIYGGAVELAEEVPEEDLSPSLREQLEPFRQPRE